MPSLPRLLTTPIHLLTLTLIVHPILVTSFKYYAGTKTYQHRQWDMWREKRDILVDCDRVAFDPETQDELQYSEQVCTDVCESLCQDPKTLHDLANCLGRMNLLACQFGYTQLQVVEAFGHWCMDRFQHMHLFVNDTAIFPLAKSTSLQTKMYFKIDPSMDDTCREGNGAILDVRRPDSALAIWPELDSSQINCTGYLWNQTKRDVEPGHTVTFEHSIIDKKIMWRLVPSLIDLFDSLNGTLHLDLGFSACANGALNPPSYADVSWAGLVMEVEAPITSVRSLYSRDNDSDFWRWKGPFVKW